MTFRSLHSVPRRRAHGRALGAVSLLPLLLLSMVGQLPSQTTLVVASSRLLRQAAPAAPPAVNNSSNATRSTSSSSSNTSCPGANHTAVSGDTCPALAGRYGTDVAELQALNPGLNCSGGLRLGQVLCVTANATAGTTGGGPRSPPPPPAAADGGRCRTGDRTYTVSPGDICYNISGSYGVSLGAIQLANPGLDCDKLVPGQMLCVPQDTAAATALTTPPPPPPAAAACPGGGLTHTVVPGDICYNISIDYGITVENLTAANPGLGCESLQPGQVLCLPPQAVDPQGGQPPPTAANGTAGSCPHATHVVASGDTCWSLALSYGVTLQALRAANPGLMCEELTPGQQLCLPETAEGPAAAPPPPPPPPPSPPGAAPYSANVSTCAANHTVAATGDTCWSVANQHGFNVSVLQGLNPGLQCDPPPGSVLCVGPADAAHTCPVKRQVAPRDSCYSIAEDYGISEDRFTTTFNPGMPCGKDLPIGITYCLPEPGDPGNVPEGCNKTYTVRSGDRCDTIAPNYGLEVAQLQTLNPGVDCEKLVIDQRLCVQPRDPLPPPPPAPPPNVPLPAPSPTPNTPPPAPSPTPNNPQLVIAQQQGRGGGGSGGGLSALEIMGTVISIVVGLLSLAAVVVVVIRRCPFWKNRPKKMTKLELKLVTMGSA